MPLHEDCSANVIDSKGLDGSVEVTSTADKSMDIGGWPSAYELATSETGVLVKKDWLVDEGRCGSVLEVASVLSIYLVFNVTTANGSID